MDNIADEYGDMVKEKLENLDWQIGYHEKCLKHVRMEKELLLRAMAIENKLNGTN